MSKTAYILIGFPGAGNDRRWQGTGYGVGEGPSVRPVRDARLP